MAVYTHLNDSAVMAHLEHYNIGTLASLQGIGEGVENTNYALTTSSGKYILTLAEGRTDAAALPFCLAFMNHVQAKGVPAPVVIADENGALTRDLAGKPAIITTFLNGAWPKIQTPAQCRLMGETLARLHLAAADFTGARINPMGLPQWLHLVGACGTRADEVEAGLAAELQMALRDVAAALPSKDALPHGAVHADAFPDNVFFKDEKLSGVIDFYYACTDFFAYDLMLALNAWCFDAQGAHDAPKSAALLAGYESLRPLSAPERAALPLFGRAAALRITATRLYDLLHPKPDAIVTAKNPLQHVRILQFHQHNVIGA
jgi:homoserine kinase type II